MFVNIIRTSVYTAHTSPSFMYTETVSKKVSCHSYTLHLWTYINIFICRWCWLFFVARIHFDRFLLFIGCVYLCMYVLYKRGTKKNFNAQYTLIKPKIYVWLNIIIIICVNLLTIILKYLCVRCRCFRVVPLRCCCCWFRWKMVSLVVGVALAFGVWNEIRNIRPFDDNCHEI